MREKLKVHVVVHFFKIFFSFQIRVNSVNPTAVRTRMAEKEGYFDEDNVFANALKNRTPLRRFCGKNTC